MRLLIITFLTCFLANTIFSKEIIFDSIVQYTYKELIADEPDKALDNFEYLYEISKNDAQKLRSLNLIGDLLLSYGITDEALEIFLKAKKLAIQEEDYEILTRVYGYISTVHNVTKLYSASLEYLNKAKKSSKKIEDPSLRARYKGNIEQEMAIVEMERKNCRKSLKHFRKSIAYFNFDFNLENVDPHYHLSNSYGMMSKVYMELKRLDSATYYLQLAKDNIDQSEYARIRLSGYYNHSLGDIYFAKNENEKAEENYLIAQNFAEESKIYDLKIEVYSSMQKFYEKNNQKGKANEYAKLHDDMVHDHQASIDEVANILLNNLDKDRLESEAESKVKSLVINVLLTVSVVLLLLLGWYIYQKRKNQKKFKAYINSNPHKKAKPTVDKPTSDNAFISKEKEQYILGELNRLEQEKFFLKPEVSLTVLASKIGVNHRYLAYVIKQHWNTDFVSYINRLRINYIVEQIETNPDNLKYKISYLGEQCGFLSHSRFTANFKKVTGITPSTFINYVRNKSAEVEG